jgi:alpha-maltose-1-phosphate synthase
MESKILSLVHHGNAGNVRHAAAAFLDINLLNQVITTLAYNPHAKVWNSLDLLPVKLQYLIRKELSKRTWIFPQKNISTYPWYEILRLFLLNVHANKYLSIFGLTDEIIVDLGFLILDRHASKSHLKNIQAIYSYEDIAATTFEVAKQQKILCLYDLPIPYYQTIRQIMQEEAHLFPILKESIQSIREPSWKLQRKQREVELADHIFVASSVTKNSLINVGINPELINVIPYGAPTDIFQPQDKSDQCFRVLFVGKISPLKGVHYLLAAWREIQSQKSFENAQLVFIGQDRFPQGWLKENYVNAYIHIPSTSHFHLNQYYSQASVLVLPSLVDGFGLVVLEAMACGIPVIITVNTGASDVITDGVEGFIIPIRDIDAIKSKLEWCYSNPAKLAKMGIAARNRAEQLDWGVYRQKLAMVVKEKLA